VFDFGSIVYTPSHSNDGRPFIEDSRSKPSRVKFTLHARLRAVDRGEMGLKELETWFKSSAQYLGRWSRDEGWGDDKFVAVGARERHQKGVLTIKTIIPRAYWDYDINQRKKLLDKIEDRAD